MTSSWFAQDALQTILNPGVIISGYDQILPLTNNPGSDIARDHTVDANTYLVFIAMSVVGTSLNRYGYLAGQSPVTVTYGKGQNLP